MSQATIILKRGEGRTIKAGGAWIYDNEIDRIEGDVKDGEIVRVVDFDGYPMGSGFINRQSKITIRMMTRDPEAVIDDTFLYYRVKAAWEYRKAVIDTSSCRIIFGEADFLPGLVVDKYEDVLVVESLALGIDRLKPKILEYLKNILAEDGVRIRAIFERSDAKIRLKEGLPRVKGLLWKEPGDGKNFGDGWILPQVGHEVKDGESAALMDKNDVSAEEKVLKNTQTLMYTSEAFDPHIEIVENDVHYIVDVENGQKTGFFLDQKGNRMAMQQLVRRMKAAGETVRVLDCFTHTGSFALNCGLGGADSVLGLDISELAVAQATENAALNGLSDRVTFQEEDVLDYLPKLIEQGEKYDVVILDPPAFTKTRDKVKQAMKGYREINIRGMKLTRHEGYFATCSCSHFMDYETFTTVIAQAARAAHVRLRQIEYRTQAADHPILWSGDEAGYYLKFYIFQVLEER